jgi:hypothetical protein
MKSSSLFGRALTVVALSAVGGPERRELCDRVCDRVVAVRASVALFSAHALTATTALNATTVRARPNNDDDFMSSRHCGSRARSSPPPFACRTLRVTPERSSSTTPGMQTKIASEQALQQWLEKQASLVDVVVHGVDLRPLGATIVRTEVRGAMFLGCTFDHDVLAHVVRSGGIVFPSLAGFPFEPYRARLYTPDELLEGWDRSDAPSYWTTSRDARIYAWYSRTRADDVATPIVDALAQRLHDHAIEDALQDLLHDPANERRVVGIMGGHGVRRSDAAYRDVAHLAFQLAARGYFLVSGGGPGAMEATNLGAFYARRSESELDAAIELLARAPTYRDEAWIATALEVRARISDGCDSLGVPTWFYGHEPSNVFATHHAKYFSNSLREDGLLAIARHGVIYAPGSAGTVQEIFQDAAQNHYGTIGKGRSYGGPGEVSPMVLLGRDYWLVDKPVFPLLTRLAAGRRYAGMLAVEDDIAAVVRFIEDHPPVAFSS